MKLSSTLFLYLLLVGSLVADETVPYQYIFPQPQSSFISLESTIIIRDGSIIDKSSLSLANFQVTGSRSGSIHGDLYLSSDKRTIIFHPAKPFSLDETITVQVKEGIRTGSGSLIPSFSYRFKTIPDEPSYDLTPFLDEYEVQRLQSISGNQHTNTSLPAPPITIDSVNNPSPGYIFMASWDRNVPAQHGNFLFILDHEGNIHDSIRVTGAPFDLKIQENGFLSYALGDFSLNVPGPGEKLRYIVMNDELVTLDSFEMKNGYPTDFHEFLYLPNGHALVMLGDVFDRGNHQTEVLWLLYRLEDQAESSGGHVHFLLGNHEVMNLRGDLRYLEAKYLTLAQLVESQYEMGYWDLFGMDSELGRWLRSKNVVERIGDFIFVHAGLSPAVLESGYSLEALNELATRMIDIPREEFSAEDSLIWGRTGPFWYRGYHEVNVSVWGPRATQTDVESILEHFKGTHLIVGHTEVDSIHLRYNGRVCAVDVPQPSDHRLNDPALGASALMIRKGKFLLADAKGQLSELPSY